ncbi:MAG: gamma carbonic anhydrase family protein [Thermoplasmatota archaeon]
MVVYSFEGRTPKIPNSSYIDGSATIVGDVKIGKDCFIAPGARIKGDYGKIIIGDKTNIQENCVVHARPKKETIIGDWVSVGHGAILHGTKVDDYAVIGMGSIVSDDTYIGEWSVVGEGAVVPNNKKIPDETVAVGVPAKIVKEVDESYKDRWMDIKKEYSTFPERYKNNLHSIQ